MPGSLYSGEEAVRVRNPEALDEPERPGFHKSHWIQWHNGAFTIFSIDVDDRLPLCPDRGPEFPGRPWYRHCYACGLDQGGRHLSHCPWVEFLDITNHVFYETFGLPR